MRARLQRLEGALELFARLHHAGYIELLKREVNNQAVLVADWRQPQVIAARYAQLGDLEDIVWPCKFPCQNNCQSDIRTTVQLVR